jgi:hypothetical protein
MVALVAVLEAGVALPAASAGAGLSEIFANPLTTSKARN